MINDWTSSVPVNGMNGMQASNGSEKAAERAANTALHRCPWQWRTDGALLALRWKGRVYHVFIPLHRIEREVNSELVGVGCPPLEPAVGAYHAVGFFGRIFKAAKKAVTTVTRPIGRAASAIVPDALERSAGRLVKHAGRAVKKAARTVARAATNPNLLKAASLASLVVPGAGPALAAGLMSASKLSTIAKTAQHAGNLASQALSRGHRTAAAFDARRRGLAAQQLLHYLR